ncbi:MAG: hypothetical protein AAF961_13150 [Planctomycetota bacterium]
MAAERGVGALNGAVRFAALRSAAAVGGGRAGDARPFAAGRARDGSGTGFHTPSGAAHGAEPGCGSGVSLLQ